jgi:hypothetical protein
MAQVFNQFIDDGDNVQMAPDFWDVSRDVFPNTKGFSTDVMLVQALLVAYFMSPAGVRPDLKAQGLQILTTFSARTGKRFDDGFYGDSTRALMTLFEEDMRAPFKDGIVRTMARRSMRGPETKLMRLNFMWNMTMVGGAVGDTKRETGRRALHPVLFHELYDGLGE